VHALGSVLIGARNVVTVYFILNINQYARGASILADAEGGLTPRLQAPLALKRRKG